MIFSLVTVTFYLVNNNYTNELILESDEKMRDCENFKKLLDLLPLLENLFNKIDLPFIEEAINQEYEKDFISMFIGNHWLNCLWKSSK